MRTFIIAALLVIGVWNLEFSVAKATEFPDAPADAWFTPYVQEVVEDGLMQGKPDGTFGSWEPMNRAEFAKTIVELRNSLSGTWWEKNALGLIFVLVTLIGWISLGIFTYKMAERPLVPAQKQEKNGHTNGIRKNSKMIATMPELLKPRKIEKKFQEPALAKNGKKKTNWWI